MKKKASKLALARETIRELRHADLVQLHGGRPLPTISNLSCTATDCEPVTWRCTIA